MRNVALQLTILHLIIMSDHSIMQKNSHIEGTYMEKPHFMHRELATCTSFFFFVEINAKQLKSKILHAVKGDGYFV